MNKNKWGIFGEVNYNKFSSTFEEDLTGNISTAVYEFLEFPVGLIYKINVTNDFKVFVRGGLAPNFVLEDSKVLFNNVANQHKLQTTTTGIAGIGLNYKRLGVEARFYSPRNITQYIYNHGSEFKQFSFRLSYSLLQFGDYK